METLIEVIARAFRKEPIKTNSINRRVRNTDNGMYARKVRVNYYGKTVGAFYMTTRKGFKAIGERG